MSRSQHRSPWIRRILTAVILPLLLIGAVEGLLRLVRFGYPTDFFVPLPGHTALTGNPKFGWRFFPRSLSRTPELIRLPERKDAGTYRIFVLGGSAAQGTPEPAYAFSRILDVMLHDAFPDIHIEVINTAMTAINSHVVLPIARDCAEYQPDLFIVYMGNNEVVGPFGPATAFRNRAMDLRRIRASLRAKTLKMGQLADLVRTRFTSTGKGASEWRGMQMFLDERVPHASPLLGSVYDHFRINLEDLCSIAGGTGADTLVCTVAVNLRGFAPFASVHGAGHSAADLASWEAAYQSGVVANEEGQHASALKHYLDALAIDDAYADLHYRLGVCYDALQKQGEARSHYTLARDLDALRFRADSRINTTIREFAERSGGPKLELVDVDALFASDEENGQTTRAQLFHEHVHLTFEGNYRIAEALYDRVAERLSLLSDGKPHPPPSAIERCAAALGLTSLSRYHLGARIWDTTGRPPFVNRLDHLEWRSRLYTKQRQREKQMTPDVLKEALALQRSACERAPDDLILRRDLARLLYENERFAESAATWQQLLKDLPGHPDAQVALGVCLLAMGRNSEAKPYFESALDNPHTRPEFCNRIGEAYSSRGRFKEALTTYQKGLDIAPEHAALQNSLGVTYIRMKDYHRAVEYLAKAVQLAPGVVVYRGNLGEALLMHGQLEQAESNLREATRIDPFFVTGLNGLGVALARQGKVEDAAATLADALRLRPEDPGLQRQYAEIMEYLKREAVLPSPRSDDGP